MTPFRNPSNAHEKRYNKKHASARNVVERCFGIKKNRFRCILGSRGLHYSPQKTSQIINACCALHNICIYYKCEEPEYSPESLTSTDIEDEENVQQLDPAANVIRNNIALNL